MRASGKTTLTLHVTSSSEVQVVFGALIDAEHALDVGMQKSLFRVDTDNLLVSQTRFWMNKHLEILETVN